MPERYREEAARLGIPSPIAMRSFGGGFNHWYHGNRNQSRAEYYRDLAERWVGVRLKKYVVRHTPGATALIPVGFKPMRLLIDLKGGTDRGSRGALQSVVARAFYGRDIALGLADDARQTWAALTEHSDPEPYEDKVQASAVRVGRVLLIYDASSISPDRRQALARLANEAARA